MKKRTKLLFCEFSFFWRIRFYQVISHLSLMLSSVLSCRFWERTLHLDAMIRAKNQAKRSHPRKNQPERSDRLD